MVSMLLKLFVLILFCVLCTADLCDDLSNSVEKGEIGETCMKQLMTVCRNTSLLWRMFDASSKYPISGMSYSNNKDLGNFEECVNLRYEDFNGTVNGKYCGLSVAIVNTFLEPVPNPFAMKMNKRKMLAEIPSINYTMMNRKTDDILRAGMDDYSITLLSLCIPDSCTPREVGKFFIWGQLENVSLVNFVNQVPCLTKDSNTSLEWGDIVFISFLSFILLLIIWSTAYDWMLQELKLEPRQPVFLAFSLLTNGKKLLHISKGNPDQIQCLNGMRFISMMWVIAGHGFIAMESVPLLNYAEIDDYIHNPKVQYAASAPIAVDTFFFLSGFLLCYGYLKSAAKTPTTKQILGVPMMYLHRYLRLTPAVAVAYFSVITIFRLLGTGPLWGAVVNTLEGECRDNWWSFFLYIQNYVNYQNMCLSHTWYLSADMQMFILAPLVLIPVTILIKHEKTHIALWALVGLTLICVGFPMLIRFLDDTIDNVYDTHSRLNDYLIGIILGVILRYPKAKKFPFSKKVNFLIWCIVIIVCLAFNIYYNDVVTDYEHTKDTLFYGLYRPVWCTSLAWMVYSCYHGYGGPINWLLSLPAFQIGGRLSYCMYLLHAIIQMYWVGLARTQFVWGDYAVFYVWCGHFIVTMIFSTIWSLAFESPMIVIEKFLFGDSKKPQKKQETPQA